MKRKDEEGEKKIAPSLPFLFFSFLFVVALVQRAGLPTLRSAARPFVVPVLPFVSPARNETPCLWLSVTQWASQIKPCLVSRNGRQGNSDSRCVVGWVIGWILLWGVEEGVGRSFVIISDVLSSDIRIVLILSLAD